jgi:hypothetical protein
MLKTGATCGERVEVGRLKGPTITTDISQPDIVGEDEDKVGSRGVYGNGRTEVCAECRDEESEKGEFHTP